MPNVFESTSSSAFRSSFLEEALPAAHHNRMDYQPELVEEVLGQQRPDERCAARDPDVLAGCRLSLVTSSTSSPFISVELFHSRGLF